MARIGQYVKCPLCGNEKYRCPSQIKKGYKACSMKCRDALKRRKLYNDEEGTKRCSQCEKWLKFDLFDVAKGAKMGANSLQSYCKACAYDINRKWAEDNDERRKHINKISQIKNREKASIRSSERWHGMTKEERMMSNIKSSEWRKKNMSKVLMWNRIRTHRNRDAGEMPSSQELSRMMKDQGYKCTYCNNDLPSNMHLDHKTPISKGGKNSIDNLQWLCPPCNLIKGTRTHDEFIEHIKTTNVKLGEFKYEKKIKNEMQLALF